MSAKLHYESEKQRAEEEQQQKRINFGEPPQEDVDAAHEENKESSFAEKRASHYNEFLVLQAMRNAHKDDEDDDDEA